MRIFDVPVGAEVDAIIVDKDNHLLFQKGDILTDLGIVSLILNSIYFVKCKYKADMEISFRDIEQRASALVSTVITQMDNEHYDLMQVLRTRSYSYEHSVHVAFLIAIYTLTYNWPVKACIHMIQAALLHDIGKASIPDKILQKKGRLSVEEREIINLHPELATKYLKEYNLSMLDPYYDAILHHHENYDGTGYPDHTKHQPEETALLHIADVYSALTLKRSYKSELSRATVFNMLESGSGTEFDPHIVKKVFDSLPRYFTNEVVLLNGQFYTVVESSVDYAKIKLRNNKTGSILTVSELFGK